MIKRILSDFQIISAAIVLLSFGALVFALTSQYVFGLNPCELCIYQRLPYVFAMAFGLVAYGAERQNKEITRLFIAISGLTFLIGAFIAGFHVGVEQEWWQGLSGCQAGNSNGMSIDELRALVLNAPVVRCSEVAWSLFGISMAGYNAVISCVMGVTCLISAIRGHHHNAEA